MPEAPSILWFRNDLRLADNPALQAAIKRGAPIIPVFIWAPEEEGEWPPGAASRWWLHQSLARLNATLGCLHSRLIILRGPTALALNNLVRQTGATAAFWNRRYEPAVRRRDSRIEQRLRNRGVAVRTFNSGLLFEPWDVQTQTGCPYQVFTAFWRKCLSLPVPPDPVPAPRRLPSPSKWPASVPLTRLALEPQLDWAAGIRKTWEPGENGASKLLRRFCGQPFLHYPQLRDRPDLPGTSWLSPHLHFGEISPRQVCHALRRFAETHGISEQTWRNNKFLAELGWREFAYHLLYHFPHTPAEPLHPKFARLRWRKDQSGLKAWQQGQTGYPFVDAGMRQLWATGRMNNRVRMVVASFLVKDLLLRWQTGARWFWDTLVDADLANNTLGWQWTAGCGADAAPFFRVFNPVAQGEKYDPEGNYVRRWVPELARLPAKWIHHPWDAPSAVLAAAGVEIGRSYPARIVPHTIAREIALEAYAKLKRSSSPLQPPINKPIGFHPPVAYRMIVGDDVSL